MIDELEVEAGPLARWQVHWCDPQRKVSWYAADPVLAVLPTLTEWAHAHGTQQGQPVLLRDGKVSSYWESYNEPSANVVVHVRLGHGGELFRTLVRQFVTDGWSYEGGP
ncbi:hypothetical protein [Streptomyces sp. ALI-76-A]|uniref:hypothetical protein n=1 Tax=Streptomyces sp. ALI-76-A TaxID=3025736 RepID=UPI00256EB0F2|nr:hypothetical protein [Streptomyces sp. ALI-76-A]MDL5206546.1 hypothetical protein [Streptomyces sp. ALI-76-A]